MTDLSGVGQEVETIYSRKSAEWVKARLGDVLAEVQAGFASGERSDSGVIQLRMNNVTTRGTFDWSQFLRVPAEKDVINFFSLQPGDVLFNNTNSTELVGKSALFDGHEESVVFSNHFTRLRTDPELLDPAFLAHWLRHQWNRRLFADICNRWIGQSAVQREKLISLEIELPPLDGQRRIAHLLTRRLHEVERARTVSEARKSVAKLLPTAYLRSVFNAPENGEWSRARLGDVCELRPSKSIATDGDTIVSAITTACLSESGFLSAGLKSARMWAGDAEECVVAIGEILVARSNTAELVGRAALFNGEAEGVVASDLTIRIWPGPRCHPPFLAGYLSYLYQTGYWIDRAGGASGSMKKITRSQIVELEIPLPPLDAQHAISSRLTEQMETVGRLRDSLDRELAAINKLSDAILGQAFSGRI